MTRPVFACLPRRDVRRGHRFGVLCAGMILLLPGATGGQQSADGPHGSDAPAPLERANSDLPEQELPWELRPYRVLVSLATEDSPTLPSPFRRQLQDRLRVRLPGVVGAFWHIEVEENDWLLPVRRETLERLTHADLAGRFAARGADKVLLLALQHDGGLRLSGLEWDASLQDRGPVVERWIVDRRRATDVAVELLLDLFRPLVRVDRAEGPGAELRARGGDLLAPQSLGVTVQPGDYFAPYFRYLSRDREVRSIQPVPWTWLRVVSIARSRLSAAVETAFNAPLAGSRRRVELVAIRVRPAYAITRLKLAPRNHPGRPLVGVRVRVYERLPTQEQPAPDMTELMTDRYGGLEVPAARSGDPLRWLTVHSGGAVLANVPFLPGVVPELALELPDDSPRLEAEGSLAILQGELIDAVARRTTMLARALSLARRDDFQQAEALLADIDRQPSIASFKSRILAIQVPAVAECRRNGDTAAEKRIIQMCRELEQLVERYLDRTSVRDVAAEINDLKKYSGEPERRGPT